jgi:hypothetical protein
MATTGFTYVSVILILKRWDEIGSWEHPSLRAQRLRVVLAMTCFAPHALHESWQDFLIFVRGEDFINDDGM